MSSPGDRGASALRAVRDPAGFLWRNSLRKGVFGDRPAWLVVFTAMGAIRLVRWLSGRERPTVVTERVEPGQTLIIRHVDR